MKVAVAGYGVEGKASFEYWNGLGHEVTIVDERDLNSYELPYGSQSILGKGSLKKLKGFDLVIRTASLPPDKIKTDGKIWSATNEFFAKCPAPIIGVTGTKGKGTTASLIASMLRAAGKTVHLVGNIGVPALSVLPSIKATDSVVFELSSFQLWDAVRSPHIAVVLMIEPDHLDIHTDMEDYVNAKAAIRRFQHETDVCLYHPTNPLSRQVARSSSHGTAARFGVEADGQVYVKDDTFYVRDHEFVSVSMLSLVGSHNLENACAAISAVRLLSVSDGAIAIGLRSFEGLEHRLKFVRKHDGVSYYDDSIATTPGSAIAALQAFDERKVIILGGSDKGADYRELLDVLKQTKTEVIAIGAIGDRLAKLCTEAGVLATRVQGDMTAIVHAATERAKNQQATIVILSPAAASFDMFKSYADRGEQFVRAVEELS